MMVHKLQPTIGATLFILWRRLTEVRFGLLTETHTGEGILRPSLPSRLHPEPSGNEAKRCLNCSICVVPRYMDVTAERLVRQPPAHTYQSGKSCPVPVAYVQKTVVRVSCAVRSGRTCQLSVLDMV